jgi:cobalt/nickel transport system permease protein
MSLTPEHVAPRDTSLARRDGRWRLAAFGLAIVGVAVLREPGPAAVALAFALFTAGFAAVPGRWYHSRIALLLLTLIPFLIVVPFVVDSGNRLWEWRFLAVTDAGLWLAVTLTMKAITLVTLGLTLVATAPMHVNLAAAGRLGVPRLLVQLGVLTHRYVYLLLDELNRLRVALRVRGFRNAMTGHAYRTVGQVTGTLLVRGSDRAEGVAHAMRCRGFDGRFRTVIPFRTRAADVAMFLLMVGTIGALVAWDVWG